MSSYPSEWQTGQIQQRIRAQANYTCESCGLVFHPVTNAALREVGEDGRPIFGHVHHLDHNPANCADDNLIFLCQRCHIQLHGLGWKPGDEAPISWGNEPPPWVVKRGLAYKPNPAVASWHEAARHRARRQDQARFIISLIESQSWITGYYDPLVELKNFLGGVLAEYQRVLEERAHEAAQPLLAQVQTWAEERGLIPLDEAIRRSGLSETDFQMAVNEGYIQPEVCPYELDDQSVYFNPAAVNLDMVAKQAVWSKVQLNRAQAAELLGVSIPLFERKRRQVGIKPVGSYQTDAGQRDYLYRKSDVLKLQR